MTMVRTAMPKAPLNASKRPNQPSSCPLDSLSEDTFAHVLSFVDFPTAVKVAKVVRKDWQAWMNPVRSPFSSLWRNLYQRHGFTAATTEEEDAVDYLRLCKDRRQLEKNLFQNKQGRQCLNLPNRFFSFVPVVPQEWEDMDEDDNNLILHNNDNHHIWVQPDDPPPVHFDCDSFLLLDTGVSGEMLFLDPFSGALTVSHVMDKCVRSDENLLEHAMLQATKRILNNLDQQEEDHLVAADAIESTIQSNFNHPHHFSATIGSTGSSELHPVQQTLLGVQDFFDVDLADYFATSSSHTHTEDHVEVEIGYLGIDSKTVYTEAEDGVMSPSETMVALGRSLWNEPTRGQQALECLEMMAWFRSESSSASNDFGDRHICRVQASLNDVDICAVTRRFYVNETSSPTIAAYPLVRVDGTKSDKVSKGGESRYFPKPDFSLKCPAPVVRFSVDCTGETLLAVTQARSLLVWETPITGAPRLVSTRQMDDALKEAFPKHCDPDGNWIEGSVAATAPVHGIFMARHLPLSRVGFVTWHHDPAVGNVLLLWKMQKDPTSGGEAKACIQAMINLPLRARRHPKIHYDGRRLIVYGQDHIGLIVLVYQCSTGLEEIASSKTTLDASNSAAPESTGTRRFEASGGVVAPQGTTATHHKSVVFLNRIRHHSLGGLADYESLLMTCNERFLVMNTKTGNLLLSGGGSFSFPEGLLVMDLDDVHAH